MGTNTIPVETRGWSEGLMEKFKSDRRQECGTSADISSAPMSGGHPDRRGTAGVESNTEGVGRK